jgi:hypothetical protein
MKSKFVIDSNSFVEPSRLYYSMSRFPSYWAWIEGCITGASKYIIIPGVVYDELSGSNDNLSQWLESTIKPFVFRSYETNPTYLTQYGKIMNYLQNCGYYGNAAIANWSQEWKADPKLIAMAATYDWKIITREQPAGYLSTKNRSNKEPKIPDVASAMGVECVSLFEVEEALKLSI